MATVASGEGAVPDRGYRHYALAILTIIYFFNFVDRQVLAVLLEDIKIEFELSDTQLGLLSGLAFALFYSTLGIPIARLADRANRVKIIAAACAIWSVATAACGLATNFFQLLMTRVAVGVGEAGCTPPTHAVLADFYRKSELSRALALLTAAAPAGAMAGVISGGWIAENYGWRHAFIIVGLPGLLVATIACLTLREPERGRLSAAPPGAAPPAFLETAKRLFSNRVFFAVTLGNGFAVMMAYVVANWVPPLYRRVFELGAAEVGLYAALGIVIGSLPGTIAGGVMSDAMVKRDPRWQVWIPAIGLILAFPLILVAPFSTTVLQATLIFAAGTFLSHLCLGPAAALIQTVARPNERALASSLYIFFSSALGIGLGPLVVGLLSDGFAASYGTDSLRYAIAATSGLALMATAMFLIAAPPLKRTAQPVYTAPSIVFPPRLLHDMTSTNQGKVMLIDATRPYDPDNIFARILRGEIPNETVYEDAQILAFKDINPQAPIHVLVIPKGEYVSWDDFSVRAPDAEIGHFVRKIGEIARDLGLVAPGYRLLANIGGHGHQEVPHLHVHLFGGKPLGPMLARG